MYTQTQAQIDAERRLNAQGFRFSNWIDAQDPQHPDAGTMVMVKRGATRYGKEYREIEPDGAVN